MDDKDEDPTKETASSFPGGNKHLSSLRGPADSDALSLIQDQTNFSRISASRLAAAVIFRIKELVIRHYNQ